MWVREVEKKLKEIYGDKKGNQTSMVIIPAFMSDFKSLLKKANYGDTISEHYRTEDRMVDIILTGVKNKVTGGDRFILTAVSVNDKDIPIEVNINGSNGEEIL
ncbi:MAG: hypothetical protein K6G03_08505 [Lachnospiraceae bacterium]|nr:hypothetical protein [Lachnospiraceae bacterium]